MASSFNPFHENPSSRSGDNVHDQIVDYQSPVRQGPPKEVEGVEPEQRIENRLQNPSCSVEKEQKTSAILLPPTVVPGGPHIPVSSPLEGPDDLLEAQFLNSEFPMQQEPQPSDRLPNLSPNDPRKTSPSDYPMLSPSAPPNLSPGLPTEPQASLPLNPALIQESARVDQMTNWQAQWIGERELAKAQYEKSFREYIQAMEDLKLQREAMAEEERIIRLEDEMIEEAIARSKSECGPMPTHGKLMPLPPLPANHKPKRHSDSDLGALLAQTPPDGRPPSYASLKQIPRVAAASPSPSPSLASHNPFRQTPKPIDVLLCDTCEAKRLALRQFNTEHRGTHAAAKRSQRMDFLQHVTTAHAKLPRSLEQVGALYVLAQQLWVGDWGGPAFEELHALASMACYIVDGRAPQLDLPAQRNWYELGCAFRYALGLVAHYTSWETRVRYGPREWEYREMALSCAQMPAMYAGKMARNESVAFKLLETATMCFNDGHGYRKLLLFPGIAKWEQAQELQPAAMKLCYDIALQLEGEAAKKDGREEYTT